MAFARLGRWWNDAAEIDLVGLQIKARQLPLADAPLWVLASRSGFDSVLHTRAAHGDLLLLTPDDLF
ncbi:MAG: hypothetical protein ACYDCQ_14155 [Dehalococcoidia bacterium]